MSNPQLPFEKSTEAVSKYRHLEKAPLSELLKWMNQEDQSVPEVIAKILPSIELVVDAVVDRLLAGGRLFYIGAGTSGRLGIVDASECPPTFGIEQGIVIGLMAGGDSAIRKAVEFAEDDRNQGWKDLELYQICTKDVVIGIAASGSTPYVVGAIEQARAHGIITACITCNAGSPLAKVAELPIVAVVGPEFVTGSTRLKAGTAQKLILNMISTCSMIRLGRVEDHRMVDMQLTNDKLMDRGTRMIMEALRIDYETARVRLLECGSVRKTINRYSQP